uniref:Uncharacterized protein n=1 Tax=Rhizophora mucronata TaxID=61149 RepID=A0A2P2PHL8_RHIMU
MHFTSPFFLSFFCFSGFGCFFCSLTCFLLYSEF